MRFSNALVGAFVVFHLGCSNPKSLVVTATNREEIAEKIGKSSMTPEEKQLFIGALAREGLGAMAKMFGGSAPSLNGKTVSQIIDEQAKYVKETQEAAAKEAALAAQAKAREEALMVELRKAISLAVFSKGFLDSDPMNGRFKSLITIKCVYENSSGKDIRAFTGSIRFTDLFDKPIFESSLTISDPIKAGSKANWLGTIDHNPFMSDREALKNTDLSDMKVVWLPKSIIFSDGTKLGMPE